MCRQGVWAGCVGRVCGQGVCVVPWVCSAFAVPFTAECAACFSRVCSPPPPHVLCLSLLTDIGVHFGLAPEGPPIPWPDPVIQQALPWEPQDTVEALLRGDVTSAFVFGLHLWLLGVQSSIERDLGSAFEAMLGLTVVDALGFVPRVGTAADARSFVSPLGTPLATDSSVRELCTWCVRACVVWSV